MKKLLTLMFAVVLLVTCFVATAFAAAPVVSVSSAKAELGDTVTVDVSLSGNTGFDAYNIALNYGSGLELIELKAGALSNGMFMPNVDAGQAGFINALTVTGDGVLFTATFKVVAAEAGTFPVSATIINLGTGSGEMGATATAGAITVEAPPAPACQHTNTNVVGAKEATCSEAGYTGDTFCNDCQTTIKTGSAIAKKAHTEKVINAKEATCAAEGYTGDTVCSVCGTEIKKGEAIAKKVHTEKVVGAKEATCAEAGYTGDTVCSVCGTEIKKGEAIAKKAHTEKVVNAKEATCKEAGYTGDTVCSVCGAEIKKGEAIAKKEHNWNWVIDKKAAAKETGLKHEECAVCGEKRNEGTVIPATGAGLDDVPQTSDITLTILPIVALVLAIAVFTVIANKRKAVK